MTPPRPRQAPPPLQLGPLPRGATPEARDRHLSECLLKVSGRLNEATEALFENNAQTTLLGLAIERLQKRGPHEPPPMRPPATSSSDAAEMLGQEASERIARESLRPDAMPSPARVAVIVAELVQAELRRVKVEALEKAEAEKLAAEKRAAEQRDADATEAKKRRDDDLRTYKKTAVLGLITMILSIVGAYVAGTAKAIERKIDPPQVQVH